MWPIRPGPPSAGPTTTAPAPSANSAAVPRSDLSMKRLSTSAPITSTCSQRPLSTCAAASERADRKPVQAAPTSIAPARSAPRSHRHQRRGVGQQLVGADRGHQHQVDVARRAVRPAPAPAGRRRRRGPAGARPPTRGGARARPCGGRSTARSRRRPRRPWRWSPRCPARPSPARRSPPGCVRALARGARRSETALRIGGLHRERRLGLDAVERLAHEVGQHPAGAGLDVAGRRRARAGRPSRRSSGRGGERRHELLAHVLERRGGDAGEHGHARLAQLDRAPRGRGTARRRAPSAASGRRRPPAGAWRAPCARAADSSAGRAPTSAPDSTSWSGALSLAIDEAGRGGDLLDGRALAHAHGEHAAVAGCSAASCMRRPRAATRRRPSAASIASAATSAVISPSEWPAIRSASKRAFSTS